MFLMDRFFDGTFLTFGIEVISFAERDQEDRIDPMVGWDVARDFLLLKYFQVYIFPRMTKCTFHKFGTSGEIEKHDAMCILPLNIGQSLVEIKLYLQFFLLFSEWEDLYFHLVLVPPTRLSDISGHSVSDSDRVLPQNTGKTLSLIIIIPISTSHSTKCQNNLTIGSSLSLLITGLHPLHQIQTDQEGMYQHHHQEDQDGRLVPPLHAWPEHWLSHLQRSCPRVGPEAGISQQGYLRNLVLHQIPPRLVDVTRHQMLSESGLSHIKKIVTSWLLHYQKCSNYCLTASFSLCIYNFRKCRIKEGHNTSDLLSLRSSSSSSYNAVLIFLVISRFS